MYPTNCISQKNIFKQSHFLKIRHLLTYVRLILSEVEQILVCIKFCDLKKEQENENFLRAFFCSLTDWLIGSEPSMLHFVIFSDWSDQPYSSVFTI